MKTIIFTKCYFNEDLNNVEQLAKINNMGIYTQPSRQKSILDEFYKAAFKNFCSSIPDKGNNMYKVILTKDMASLSPIQEKELFNLFDDGNIEEKVKRSFVKEREFDKIEFIKIN